MGLNMSSKARHIVIEMISDKLGFSFNEEELSPKTRRQIGITSKKVEELSHLLELKTSYESNSTSYFLYSFIAGFFGAILLIPAAYNPPEVSWEPHSFSFGKQLQTIIDRMKLNLRSMP